MSGAMDTLANLLARDEDDPFAPVRVRRWNKYAKSVDALPARLIGVTVEDDQKGIIGRDGGSTIARMRAASGIPEAVVKVASYGAGKESAIGQLDYISRDGNLELEMNDGSILDGKEDIRDLIEHWEENFHYRKGGSRNTMHMVVSAPDGSDPEAVLQAGRDFAETTFGDNHPYALVRHDDGTHPHVHIVTRMRGEDGEMFRIERGGFHELRESFAQSCRDNGIEMNATSRTMRGTARSEQISLRKMREDGRIPQIDRQAADLVSRERHIPDIAKTAMAVRQIGMDRQALAHRELATAFDSLGAINTPEGKAFRAHADNLRELAHHLEEGGDITRPEKTRGTRKDRMEDDKSRDLKKPEQRRSGEPTDQAAFDIELVKAQERAIKGEELARALRDKLPEGPDRARATITLENIGEVNDRLHGRDPDRTMRADQRDTNVIGKDGLSASEPTAAPRPVPGSVEHAAIEAQKIREREKERNRSREKDRDDDR